MNSILFRRKERILLLAVSGIRPAPLDPCRAHLFLRGTHGRTPQPFPPRLIYVVGCDGPAVSCAVLHPSFMNIDLYNIDAHADEEILWRHLASVLHAPPYTPRRSHPIEFSVRIFGHNGRGRKNGGMLLPTAAVGQRFLTDFGGKPSRRLILIHGTIVVFKRSTRAPQRQVGTLRGPPRSGTRVMPCIKPTMLDKSVAVEAIQFGYYCRDDRFSVEWERSAELTTILAYDGDRAMFKLALCERSGTTRYAGFRAASIYWVGAGSDANDGPVISFGLNYAPSYLVGSWRSPKCLRGYDEEQTVRASAFEDSHAALAPFTSSSIRILCKTMQDLDRFRELAGSARIQVEWALYPAVRRSLFTLNVREIYEAWVTSLPWPVAFQLEAMVRASLVDLKEVRQDLRARIEGLNKRHGPDATGAFLQDFHMQLLLSSGSEDGGSLQYNWESAMRSFLQRPRTLGLPMVDNEDLFSPASMS